MGMKKDDLISRAAAIAEIEQWAEHGYQTIHWTGIKAMLEVQPAVDAIPVEWLCENIREEAERGNILHAEYIKGLIWEWHQKKQEA